ncbi:membrane protein ORF139 [Cyprinid herpesvirus 3]|uniref:ORF139L n=1 Tax=Cyprinid herpesvirus 3 TaxID=180230 RepID=A0A060IBS7_CYHV3|nr:ORF139L [Cyprinid herpesvirus 3]AOO33326.1 membrane protein ORF139 [Cyprinid herpesvirus 3]AVL28068.1 protein ORF139 [Cyprinid herpesvirus 3]AVL28390.1 protein ORF139 [Cyprinid herpesvirus 3]AVL28545.1 protein ORF139 [Cyprinid herpesvirus 3]
MGRHKHELLWIEVLTLLLCAAVASAGPPTFSLDEKFSEGERPKDSVCYVHNTMGASAMGNKAALSQVNLDVEVDSVDGLKLDGFYYDAESADESWSRVYKSIFDGGKQAIYEKFARDLILKSCDNLRNTTYPMRSPDALPVQLTGEAAIGIGGLNNMGFATFNLTDMIFSFGFDFDFIRKDDLKRAYVRARIILDAEKVAVYLNKTEVVVEKAVFDYKFRQGVTRGYSENLTYLRPMNQTFYTSPPPGDDYCALVRFNYTIMIESIQGDYDNELILLDNIQRVITFNVTGIPTGGKGLPNIITECILKTKEYANDTCPENKLWFTSDDIYRESRNLRTKTSIAEVPSMPKTTKAPKTTTIVSMTINCTTPTNCTNCTADCPNSYPNETVPEEVTVDYDCLQVELVKPIALPVTYDPEQDEIVFSLYAAVNRTFDYTVGKFNWETFCLARHIKAITNGDVYLTMYPYWRYMFDVAKYMKTNTEDASLLEEDLKQNVFTLATLDVTNRLKADFFEMFKESHCNTWEDLALVISSKLYLDTIVAVSSAEKTAVSTLAVIQEMFDPYYTFRTVERHKSQLITNGNAHNYNLNEIITRHPEFKPARKYRRVSGPSLTVKSLTYLNCQKPINKTQQEARKRTRRALLTVVDHTDETMLCAFQSGHHGEVGSDCTHHNRRKRGLWDRIKGNGNSGAGQPPPVDRTLKPGRVAVGPGTSGELIYSEINHHAAIDTKARVDTAVTNVLKGQDFKTMSNDKLLDVMKKVKHQVNGGATTNMYDFRQKYGLGQSSDVVYSSLEGTASGGRIVTGYQAGGSTYSMAGYGGAGGAAGGAGAAAGGAAGGGTYSMAGYGGETYSMAGHPQGGGGGAAYASVNKQRGMGGGMSMGDVYEEPPRYNARRDIDINERLTSHARDNNHMTTTSAQCGRRFKRDANAMCMIRPEGNPFGGTADGLKAMDIDGDGKPDMLKAMDIDGDGKPDVLRIMDPDGDGHPGIGAGLMPPGPHIQMTGGVNPMAVMAGGMMASMMATSLSASNTRSIDNILSGKYAGVDKQLAVTLATMDKLNEFGSMMAMGGGMAAMMTMNPAAIAVAGVGLGLQMITSLVTFSIQIHQLLYPTNPPRDPILDKYMEYRKLMLADAAGNRWCMMPESKLEVTLGFFNRSVHLDGSRREDGKQTTALWAPAGETRIKVLYNPLITFNAQLKVTCAGDGALRFNEFNSKMARTRGANSVGTSVWDVTQLASMVASEPVIHGRCGEATNLIIEREFISEADMILLQKRGPGEPALTAAMPSDVCDLFPFKKFYVSMPSCSYEPGEPHYGWTTCSMMFKRAIWNPVNGTWMVPNPFTPRGSDRKLFTFSRRDFRTYMPIKPNSDPQHKLLCSNAIKPGLCRLPEVFGVEDTSKCNNKARFFRVHVAKPVNASLDGAIQGYMMTCQPGSIASFIIKKGSPDNMHMLNLDSMGTARTFFLKDTEKEKAPVVWIFCQHMSMPAFKSDIIELMLDDTDTAGQLVSLATDNYAFSENWANSIMFRISRIGPRWQYDIPEDDENRIKFLPEIKRHIPMSDVVQMDINGGNGENFDSKETFSFKTEMSLHDLDDHFDDEVGRKWLDWAQRGCKATSSVQVNIGFCSTVKDHVEMDLVGWFRWGWVDEPWGKGTLAVDTDSWVFKIPDGKDTLTLKKAKDPTSQEEEEKIKTMPDYTFTHKLKKCNVYIDLKAGSLKIDCPTTDLTVNDLVSTTTGKRHTHMCVTVSPAKDSCAREKAACGTRTSEFADQKLKKAYWEDMYKDPEWTMYTPYWYWCEGSEPRIGYYYFCQDQGVRRNTLDGQTRSTVLVYQKMYDYTPPMTKSYQSANRLGSDDLVIEAAKYKKMEEAHDAVGKIYDLINDPLVKAINSMASGLTAEGRQVARVNVPHDFVLQSDQQRLAQIEILEEQVNELMMDLMVDALSASKWYEEQIFHIQKKCCVLSLNDAPSGSEQPWSLFVEALDPMYAFFKCPLPRAFYLNYNETSGKIWGPQMTYETPDNIDQYLRSKSMRSWTVCLNNREIIFETEDIEKQFNKTLYEQIFERESVIELRKLENAVEYGINMTDKLNRQSWFRRYNVYLGSAPSELLDDEVETHHNRRKRAVTEGIRGATVYVESEISTEAIVVAAVVGTVILLCLIAIVFRIKNRRRRRQQGSRRISKMTERMGLAILGLRRRLDIAKALWGGKQAMELVLNDHVRLEKQFRRWAKGETYMLWSNAGVQVEVEVDNEATNTCSTGTELEPKLMVSTANSPIVIRREQTYEDEMDDDDDERSSDGAECIKLLDMSRSSVSINSQLRNTLSRGTEPPPVHKGAWNNKPGIAPGAKKPQVRHFHTNKQPAAL